MTFDASMMQNMPSSAMPIPTASGGGLVGGGGIRGIGDPLPTAGSSQNRQRRPRSRRDRDRKFTCDFKGCDKTYTRAEHLTRHQLNRMLPFTS
jgi:hypothetical protein